MKKKCFILTANHTLTGHSLYWHSEGHWQQDIYDAQVFQSKADCEDLLQGARTMEAMVCDPYLEAVNYESGRLVVIGKRQAIRQAGQDVLSRLGYSTQ